MNSIFIFLLPAFLSDFGFSSSSSSSAPLSPASWSVMKVSSPGPGMGGPCEFGSARGSSRCLLLEREGEAGSGGGGMVEPEREVEIGSAGLE